MNTLTLRQLNSIAECSISEIFLQNDKIHYVIQTWILKTCLGLACNTVWETKVGHYGAWFIWWTYKISCFHFALRLVWTSITIINATCKFEQGSHFCVESPFTSKLKLLAKRKHHIDVNAVYSLVLFEHSGVLQKLVKSFRFPIENLDKAWNQYILTFCFVCSSLIPSFRVGPS